jgi:ABC-type transport system involved in Fe-S cluster assembly fused permease/ATPase subunit
VARGEGVANGSMTLGDLVLVNAFLIQLYMPLNHLGMLYREIRQSLTDIERMFGLLRADREMADAPDARSRCSRRAGDGTVLRSRTSTFFAYDANRQILHDVSFEIPALAAPWRWSATAAPANRRWRACCSASTTCRADAVRINGQDIRSLQQKSLRAAIGIVPQDTVLFNDTIFYNIQYGRPEREREEVLEAAARRAHPRLHREPAGRLRGEASASAD